MQDFKPILPKCPIHTAAIDDVAFASLRASFEQQARASLRCDLCDAPIEQVPAASGLLLWTRGDEVRADEPPLCAECASSIATLAFASWMSDDEAGE